MILERDEQGFFERVITVHPIAFENKRIDLGPVHTVFEFAAGRGLVGGVRFGAVLAAPFRLLALIPRIAALVRSERIDIIRANDVYFMGLLGWAVSRRAGVPFCVSLHADYDKRFALAPRAGWHGVLRRIARRLPPFVLRRADGVLPIRRHLADWAIAQGADPKRVHLIPHGIDLTPFRANAAIDVRERYGIPADRKIISFVGRFTRDNYIHDAVEIAAAAVGTRDDVVVVMAGDGPEREAVIARVASDPRLARTVLIVGAQPYDAVVALRQASSVALCLMGGFSLLEACAAGCVPVTYDVEWHRELIEDGANGFVVGEHATEDAVHRVTQLLDVAGLASRMGAEARRRVMAAHDLQRTSQIKRDAYAQIIRES